MKDKITVKINERETGIKVMIRKKINRDKREKIVRMDRERKRELLKNLKW